MEKGSVYWSRAAAQGTVQPGSDLVTITTRLGTDIDYETAASHYRIASEQQNNARLCSILDTCMSLDWDEERHPPGEVMTWPQRPLLMPKFQWLWPWLSWPASLL